jgi:hypothetical protein
MRRELSIFTGVAIGVLVLGGLATRIFALTLKLKPDFDDSPGQVANDKNVESPPSERARDV